MSDFAPDSENDAMYDSTAAGAVFPDGEALIARAIAEQTDDRDEYACGRAGEYRMAHVPGTNVFVLYGIYPKPGTDNDGIIDVISIRSYTPGGN